MTNVEQKLPRQKYPNKRIPKDINKAPRSLKKEEVLPRSHENNWRAKRELLLYRQIKLVII